MPVCTALANGVLTGRPSAGEQARDLLGRDLVALRQEVRIRREQRIRVVAQAGGCDVCWDALGEQVSRVSVSQDVERPGRDASRRAESPESIRQGLRVKRSA
jgi:hypothetical protein